MKLLKAQVKNFRSVEDSNEFKLSDMTCLVGKNEAGKTALLQALWGMKPRGGDFEYDRTRDYPRRYLTRFTERHPDARSDVAITDWELSDADVAAVAARFGPSAIKSKSVNVTTHIEGPNLWIVSLDARACLDHLIRKHVLDAVEQGPLKPATDAASAIAALNAIAQRSEKQNALLQELSTLHKQSFDLEAIQILAKAAPGFFYTSHFDRMSGEIALNQLAQDREKEQVKMGDKIFLDFLQYAGTSLEELQGAKKFEELKAKCEAASNDITDEIFQFWSQNDALEVKIDIGQGRPEDKPPFNNGTVVKIRIENKHHRASIPLSERSAGFVWFFSFLAQFKQLRKSTGRAIILLDEPGLTLHGKAQSDLLRYIRERIVPEHQVIYTTHSPFMVPSDRMEDVRIVQDVVQRQDRGRPIVLGTKVKDDVLNVDEDTIFPLQGALGYEITQSLFIGRNTLLVEGSSDVVYMHAFSNALKRRGRAGLDSRWTICPSGGIDKIAPFASLFGGNRLNIAVLSDYASGDRGKIERLRKSDILRAGRLLTVADFTGNRESDVEDLIHTDLYVEITNAAFALQDAVKLSSAKLNADTSTERLVKKTENAFKTMPPGSPEFDHYTPADWLIRNPALLDSKTQPIDDALSNFERVFAALNKFLSD